MAYVLGNAVQETTNKTGDGDVVILDGAVAGFRTFDQGVGNGNSCTVRMWNTTTGEFEIFEADFTNSPSDRVTRTTQIESSEVGDTEVVWTGGPHNIAVVLPGQKLESLTSPDNQGLGFIVRTAGDTYTNRSLGTDTPTLVTFDEADGHPTAKINVDAVPAVAGGVFTGAVTLSGGFTSGASSTFAGAYTRFSPATVDFRRTTDTTDRILEWASGAGLADHRLKNYVGGTAQNVLNDADIPISTLTAGEVLVAATATTYAPQRSLLPEYINTYTFTAATTLDIPIPAGYDEFLMKVVNLRWGAAAGGQLTARIADNATPIYETTGYSSHGQEVSGGSGANNITHQDIAEFRFTNGTTAWGGDTGPPRETVNGEIRIVQPGDSTDTFKMFFEFVGIRADGARMSTQGACQMDSDATVTRAEFFQFQSGTVSAPDGAFEAGGEIYLYGINR